MDSTPGLRPGALRAARLAAGLTQHELARRIEVAGGERIASWERGAVVPRAHLVQRLVQVLQVPAEQLLAPSEVMGLRQLRVAAGLSARELADKVHVSVPTLARWESGRFTRPLRHEGIRLLAQSLDVPVERVQQALAPSSPSQDASPGQDTATGK
ncbi:helix-turn-helix transcriptional regulator [Aquipuribacter hungaricus]|uniref:Helix-turn-helix transcriptional regulator n=1 Tax=Aquipuribacter hungaricus TaxID=545624 RepID=A0ABV7WHE1_9MICO